MTHEKAKQTSTVHKNFYEKQLDNDFVVCYYARILYKIQIKGNKTNLCNASVSTCACNLEF